MLRNPVLTLLLLSATALAFGTERTEEPKGKPAAADEVRLSQSKTIVLVRHAEKDAQGDPRDPMLSAVGTARAKTLAHMLAQSGVTHLYATEFHRTQDTLAPLALACQKKVEVVPGAKLDDLTRQVDALPDGSVVVIAGHSNTVPAIAQHFGLKLSGATDTKSGPVLPDEAYDRLYVLTVPAVAAHAQASVFEMRYGD